MDESFVKIIEDISFNNKLLNYRKLFLPENIDIPTSSKLVSNLIYLNEVSSTEKITLYINSNGGEVEGGLLAIYDAINSIQAPVETFCIGEAHSSAAFILASGTKGLRCAYKHSKIMIHGVQASEFSGDQENFKQEIKAIKKLNNSLFEILSKHTSQPLVKIKKDLKKEKFFSAKEALDYGLIDIVIENK